MTKQREEVISQEMPPTFDPAASNGDAEQAAVVAPPRVEIQVDEKSAMVCNANFCRVTGTSEELIWDFGLNAQPMGTATNIDVKQRLFVNYFTAKRLLQALAMSIQRHENAFGVLETDIQKRVSPAVRRASGAV